MHKNHSKTQEKALKRLCFSKFSGGACPWVPLEVSAPLARVGQICVCSPNISKPVCLCNYGIYMYIACTHCLKRVQ